MALAISIDVYQFSTGMDFDRKITKIFEREHIADINEASIYNFRGQYFNGVRSKITHNSAGVLKDYYVSQTVADIKTLLDA